MSLISILEYPFICLFSLFSTTTILTVVAVAAITYYWYVNSSHDDWDRYGVRAPKLSRSFLSQPDIRAIFTTLLTQYGDIVGINARGRLSLVTTNFDLLRHILIKDFNNFIDREDDFPSISPFAKSLFFARGSEWRRHRQIVSPTFSTGKLKHISKSVEASALDLTKYIETFAKSDKLVPIKHISGQYTCEIVAKTAFGLDANCIGQESEFYKYASNMIRFNVRRGLWRLLHRILSHVPYLPAFTRKVLSLQYFDAINTEANRYFDVVIRSTVADRRQQQSNGAKKARVDFLDLLLKANEAASSGTLKATEEEFKSSDWSQEGKSVESLTEEEIVGQSMLIIFAGMETTATTLQMCLFELAANPDIQEQVFQEIQNVVKSDSPTSEELNSLNYTEQVINETLRLYPPVHSVSRMAKETKTYNGVTIPKNVIVHIPYFYILRDPNIFSEPDKFDPHRFSPEEKEKRDSLAFCAFGHGPRLCLGMRLAYLELKQGLVHVLRKLQVVLDENTEPKKGAGVIAIKDGGLLTPEKPIMLHFKFRQANNF